MARYGSTASVSPVPAPAGGAADGERFTCAEGTASAFPVPGAAGAAAASAAAAGSAWRSAVFRGVYTDPAGIAHPALVKVFRTPAAFQREVMGLSMARLLGIGPQPFMTEGVVWPGHRDARLPDGRPVAPDCLMVCEEDAGVSLERVLELRARARRASRGPRPCAHAASAAPARSPADEDTACYLAGLPDAAWERLCDKVLLDLAVQVNVLQGGLGASGEPLVHGDIKPANICVRLYGDDVATARATLIDFESLGGATRRGMDKRPSTPFYRAHLPNLTSPRVYDLGCLALVCHELYAGPLRHASRGGAKADDAVCRAFSTLPTRDVFCFRRGHEGGVWLPCGDASQLPTLAERLARKLGLSRVDEEFPAGSEVLPVARTLLGGRIWMDQKDKIDLGGDVKMEFGDYCAAIAVAINECYNRAVDEGAWARGKVTAEADPALYAQNLDQAKAWLGYLTCDLDCEVVHRGEEPSAPVAQLEPAELAQLELLEHNRWLAAKRAQGWHLPTAEELERLERELPRAEAASEEEYAERRKRLLDSWKANELMRPWDELAPAEQLMTRRMMENLVPVLADLGLSVCR